MADADLFGTTAYVAAGGVSRAGRPRLPIRLMVSLLYLKHAFNESDESVCARWSENVVWQLFSGMEYYRTAERVNGASNSSNDAALAGWPGVGGSIDVLPGDRIPLLPRRMLKLHADLDLGAAWTLGADAIAMSGALARGNENGQHRPDGTYHLGAGRSAGYAVVNINAAWKPAKGLKLFAQVNNLLDRAYATAAQLGPTGFDAAGNFQSRPFAANANGDRPLRHAAFFAPGAPRALSIGLKYAY